jgi:hypothetical protein
MNLAQPMVHYVLEVRRREMAGQRKIQYRFLPASLLAIYNFTHLIEQEKPSPFSASLARNTPASPAVSDVFNYYVDISKNEPPFRDHRYYARQRTMISPTGQNGFNRTCMAVL